jgi:hypothetical protein
MVAFDMIRAVFDMIRVLPFFARAALTAPCALRRLCVSFFWSALWICRFAAGLSGGCLCPF